jgi:hypothetical protein
LKKPQGAPIGNDNRAIQRDQNDPFERTADKLAKEHGISAPTIKRDGNFYAEVERLKVKGQYSVIVLCYHGSLFPLISDNL